MAGETLPTGSTNTQGLADWAAPYITNYLGEAQALSQTPYQTYQGPLTAGASQLQTDAFKGLGGLTVPNQGQYTPVGGSFTDTGVSAQYMNPYLQQALNPQLEEARRQAQITQMQNASKMTQAGAFGGSRQAILDAENQRNLGTTLSNITGQGYASAYDKAMQQYNAEQARKIQEAQYGADFGLKGLAAEQGILKDQLGAGAVQRGITSEGIAADVGEFEKQRQYPYQQVQFQRDMISGLPTGSVTNTPGQLSGVGQLLSVLGGGTAAASALGYKNVGELLSAFGLNVGQKES